MTSFLMDARFLILVSAAFIFLVFTMIGILCVIIFLGRSGNPRSKSTVEVERENSRKNKILPFPENEFFGEDYGRHSTYLQSSQNIIVDYHETKSIKTEIQFKLENRPVSMFLSGMISQYSTGQACYSRNKI